MNKCYKFLKISINLYLTGKESRQVVFQHLNCLVHLTENANDRVLVFDYKLGPLQRPFTARLTVNIEQNF